jgi:hypothetical protein
MFFTMALSYDDGVTLDPERKLLQRLRWRPGGDISRKIVGPGVAGTEHPFFVFLIVHEASQMGADPGESDIPLVRPVDDDSGRIVDDDVLRVSDGDLFFTENEPFCYGLAGRGRKKFEKRVKEEGEGRQTQEGERFLQEFASIRHGGCEVDGRRPAD